MVTVGVTSFYQNDQISCNYPLEITMQHISYLCKLKKLLILFSSSKNTCWKILLAIQHSWREYWCLKDPIKRLVYGGMLPSILALLRFKVNSSQLDKPLWVSKRDFDDMILNRVFQLSLLIN